MTNTANFKKIWNMRYLKKTWSIVFRPNTCTINILYIYIPHFSKVTNTRINPMNVLSLQEKLTSTNLNSTI